MNRYWLPFLLLLSVEAKSSCISQELRSGFEEFSSGAVAEFLVTGAGHYATLSGGSIIETENLGTVYLKAWHVASSSASSSGMGSVLFNPLGMFLEFDYRIASNIQVVIQLLDSGQSVIHEHSFIDEGGRFRYQTIDGGPLIHSLAINVVGGDGGIYIDNLYYFGTSHLKPCNDVVSSRSGGSIGFPIVLALVFISRRIALALR